MFIENLRGERERERRAAREMFFILRVMETLNCQTTKYKTDNLCHTKQNSLCLLASQIGMKIKTPHASREQKSGEKVMT
jgi:hypothetical protein